MANFIKKNAEACIAVGAIVVVIIVVSGIAGAFKNPNPKQVKTVHVVHEQWVKIMDFSGKDTDHHDISTHAASDYFTLKTGKVKVVYTVTGTENYPILTGWVRGENQNIQYDNPYSFYSAYPHGHQGEVQTTLKPGKYNLVIDCPIESFTVQVYEQQ